MKYALRVTCLLLWAGNLPVLAAAQIKNFSHVILIVQENRTPDNLFQGLCLPPYGNANACGPGLNQYHIRNFGIDNKGKRITLAETPLGNAYDPGTRARRLQQDV